MLNFFGVVTLKGNVKASKSIINDYETIFIGENLYHLKIQIII